jgi:aryl-alcohol dehydrogenase-like predicted oxidoreductase
MKGKNRDSIIMATKVSGPSHTWFKSPKRAGMTALDRHNITVAVEDSLRRLQTDYIDLYQTHWPDHGTAYDETMETLDELVRVGKVRVLGCSNETSYGLMKSLSASERLGTTRYHTIQNNFSINNRRFEDELKQVCRQEGVSLLPYSPLGGGVLSGKYLDGARPEGARFSAYLEMAGTRQFEMSQRFAGPRALESTARIVQIAKEAGMSPVTLATAWSKQHDFVASTIVGVTREDQLGEIFAAIDLKLSDEVMTAVHKLTREILYPMG